MDTGITPQQLRDLLSAAYTVGRLDEQTTRPFRQQADIEQQAFKLYIAARNEKQTDLTTQT